MDLLVLCQGLGLAIAAGLIIGVVVPPITPAWGAFVAAAPLGILACAAPLSGEGDSIWPAFLIGPAAAGAAALITRDVVGGASRREAATIESVQAQVPPGLIALVVLAAVVVAALSVFLPPFALVAAAALAWLWLSRRRRSEEKHEGLRVLR
jgi:hypothetical protein